MRITGKHGTLRRNVVTFKTIMAKFKNQFLNAYLASNQRVTQNTSDNCMEYFY